MSKGLKILVITSLVVNVLLIGIMIGNFTSRFREDVFPQRPGHERITELPKEKQDIFDRAIEQARTENRDIHQRIRKTRERALALLTAPEFNENAYRAEMEKMHDLRGMMMKNMADATTNLAKQLDTNERKALAGMLQRPMMGPGRGRPGDHREDRPRRGMQ